MGETYLYRLWEKSPRGLRPQFVRSRGGGADEERGILLGETLVKKKSKTKNKRGPTKKKGVLRTKSMREDPKGGGVGGKVIFIGKVGGKLRIVGLSRDKPISRKIKETDNSSGRWEGNSRSGHSHDKN